LFTPIATQAFSTKSTFRKERNTLESSGGDIFKKLSKPAIFNKFREKFSKIGQEFTQTTS
jgi:hypothetical protein